MFSYHLTIFMLHLVKQHSKDLLYHFCVYLRQIREGVPTFFFFFTTLHVDVHIF